MQSGSFQERWWKGEEAAEIRWHGVDLQMARCRFAAFAHLLLCSVFSASEWWVLTGSSFIWELDPYSNSRWLYSLIVASSRTIFLCVASIKHSEFVVCYPCETTDVSFQAKSSWKMWGDVILISRKTAPGENVPCITVGSSMWTSVHVNTQFAEHTVA